MLIDRFAARMRADRRAALLVIQWHPEALTGPVAELRAGARANAIPVLDLRPALEQVVHERGAGRAFYVHFEGGRKAFGHMNPAGNRAAADAIAEAVSALPQRSG
jgi:hypothetical protein